MLGRFKWRIILSLSNLLAALVQSAAGLKEPEAFLQANPPHDQILPYIPTVQLISYCINAPALVLTNVMGRSPIWRDFWGGRYLGGYWFREISISFYLALFLLWWWIGWRIDVRQEPEDCQRAAAVIGNSIGALFSLLCLYAAAHLLMRLPNFEYAGGAVLPFSVLIWGIGLLYYFGRMLLSAKVQQRT
jgi:hypothetical protein